MHKLHDVLRLKFELGRSHREIAAILGIGHATVGRYVRRAEEAGLSWPLPEDFGDEELKAALFAPASGGAKRPAPDWAEVHRAMSRGKGMTLALLWLEYREAHREGAYEYSWFCARYREWAERVDVVMRHSYAGGERVFIDYAGQTVAVIDPETGKVSKANVFVATLAASNHTFVDLTPTRKLEDWTGSHVRMFERWGGAPELLIPDNEKAGVQRACKYEPELNPTYLEMARHYGVAVMPTRPRKPRDKAKVEAAVQHVERRVLAPLRNHRFFSLAEAREAIAPLVKALNERPFQKLEGSRQSLFEELDRSALRPLPAQRYEFARWVKARVNIDYHVQVGGCFYSVPYTLARKEVDVRVSATAIEVFHGSKRQAAHIRASEKGSCATEDAHMPAAHRAHRDWTPSRLIAEARRVGPKTGEFAEKLLERRPHPEQGYRSCLGLRELKRAYSAERLEAACAHALKIGTISRRSVQSILATERDKAAPEEEDATPDLPADHENVRGPDYYKSPTPDEES